MSENQTWVRRPQSISSYILGSSIRESGSSASLVVILPALYRDVIGITTCSKTLPVAATACQLWSHHLEIAGWVIRDRIPGRM